MKFGIIRALGLVASLDIIESNVIRTLLADELEFCSIHRYSDNLTLATDSLGPKSQCKLTQPR